MNFNDLVNKRESTRKFADKQVGLDLIKRCVESARLAPSACNSQPWRFHIISEHERKKKIAEATLQKGIALNRFALEAPVLIVISVTKGNMKTKVGQMINGLPYYLIDSGIAAEHFCLQATEEGLGTCMIGWFNESKIKEQISIKRDERIALIIAAGYASSNETRKKMRKSLDDITVVYD